MGGDPLAGMEHADWIKGFDAAQARFLMVTAITHHRFSSPVREERVVRKLHIELAEIDVSAARVVAPRRSRWRLIWPSVRSAYTRRARRSRSSRPYPLHARLGEL
jgi:hypothetical protein